MLGHGTTITFASGFFAEILGIQWSGIARTSVDQTHFGTTGAKSFTPADLSDSGELSVEMQYLTTSIPPVDAPAETCTITLPVTPPKTIVCEAFLTGFEITFADEEKVRATSTLKFTGPITWPLP